MMKMQKDEMIELSVSPTREGGKAVDLHGAPSWSSSDESVVSLEVSEDGLVCTATAKSAGKATITASGEPNEKGDDAKLEGKLEIEVEDSESVGGSMNIKVGRVGDHAKAEEPTDRHISVKERNTMQQRAVEARRAAQPAAASEEEAAPAKTGRRKAASAEVTPDRLKPPFPKTTAEGKPVPNV